MKTEMDVSRLIDEAHGLWELAVTRLAALVEARVGAPLLSQASKDERDAFANWKRVSRECGA